MLCSIHWQLATNVSGQTNSPIFKGQALQEEPFFFDSLTFKMRLKGCPKTSVTNHQSMLHYIPEQQRSQYEKTLNKAVMVISWNFYEESKSSHKKN
jgi:hypothetical protein